MSPNPIQHISTELSRFALNIDLVAQQVTNSPDPLTEHDVLLLTPAVQQIRTALEQLETSLYHAEALTRQPKGTTA